jgi:hypothetical protein
LALAIVGKAPVAEGIGVIRVEPDGLVEVRNGAVKLTLVIVSLPPVGEGFDVIRVEPYGFAVFLNGAVVLALATVTPRLRNATAKFWLSRMAWS